MTTCPVQALARELAQVGLTIRTLLEAVTHAYEDSRGDQPPWDELPDHRKGFVMWTAHIHVCNLPVPTPDDQQPPMPPAFLGRLDHHVARTRQ